MSNRLSHSSVNLFSDCSYKWKLHYQQKLRSTTMSAALLFGTAIDKAVEILVQVRDLSAAKQVFHELWKAQEINGFLTTLRGNPNIVFANNDLDKELLDGNLTPLGLEKLDIIINKKAEVGFDNLSVDDKIDYNNANWFVAKKRGELMLEAYYNEVLPKITKVLSTQEKIDLINENGDSVIGYTDLVANYEGYTEPIIFDNKTSTRAYEADSVRTSPQLALYVHALENKYKTRLAGFIVLSKTIQKNRKKICSICGNDGTGGRHKTCNAMIEDEMVGPGTGKDIRCGGEWKETIDPKAKIEVIIDTIPEQLENIVLENFDGVTKMIENNVFIRNLSACEKPWGKCQFWKVCHQNKMDDVVKVENNEKK